MTKANATETDILAKIFTATALPWDAATDLDIHLHVGDPGEAGTSATSPATYTSYAPVTVSRSASYPPGVWMLARQAGGMGSFGRIDGEGALTASGALGVAAVAELSGVGDLSVSGQLIVSAVASLSGSGALTGDVLAVLQLAADLSGSGDVAGTLVALGNAVSAITGAGALTAVPYATGELEATISPFTELSPQSLAAAVWDTAVAEYETAGTMGFAQRFLYALGHHKVVTDPVAGTFTVFDDDDVTPLFVADLWENAARTLPYDGAGSERRDAFV